MKILVTGGTGFVGGHFLNRAIADGYGVLALRHLPQSAPRIPVSDRVEWCDEVEEDAFRECGVVVHLAAHTANPPYDSYEACIEQNVIRPIALFRRAIDSGIRRFVIAGSVFEYGAAADRFDPIPADSVLEPTSSYAASKAAATIAFGALAREAGLEMIVLRLSQVYGLGEADSRFWPSLRRAAQAGDDFVMSEGLQVRDFVPVADVADQLIGAIRREDLSPGRPVIENVGTGEPMTLREFAVREWRAEGGTGSIIAGAKPMRAGEVMRIVPEVRRSA